MPKHEHTIEITSNQNRTDYRIETVGYLHGERVNDHDTVNEKSAEGHVNGGSDLYSFNAAVKGIKFPGEIGDYSLHLDGRPVSPFHINQRRLTVETPEDRAPYTVAVDGRIIGSSYTNWNDRIYDDGRRADGEVQNGTDIWYIAGLFQGIDSNSIIDADLDGKDVGGEGTVPCGLDG